MKKLLLIIVPLILLLVPPPAAAYTVTVQNPESFSSKAGPAGDVMIIEDFAGELSGVTMTVRLQNVALWYTITEQNLVSQSYTDSGGLFPTALGIIGTNRITISFPAYTGPSPAVIRLTNVWVNSQYLDSEADVKADFMAVIYGIPVERNGVVLAHWTPEMGNPTDIPLNKSYLRYWSCEGKWWAGAALMNDSSAPADIGLAFHTRAGQEVSVSYRVPAGGTEIVAFYNDPRLAGHSGYVRITVPPGCEASLLLGDGTQMVSM